MTEPKKLEELYKLEVEHAPLLGHCGPSETCGHMTHEDDDCWSCAVRGKPTDDQTARAATCMGAGLDIHGLAHFFKDSEESSVGAAHVAATFMGGEFTHVNDPRMRLVSWEWIKEMSQSIAKLLNQKELCLENFVTDGELKTCKAYKGHQSGHTDVLADPD
jgi:hypothetical protein